MKQWKNEYNICITGIHEKRRFLAIARPNVLFCRGVCRYVLEHIPMPCCLSVVTCERRFIKFQFQYKYMYTCIEAYIAYTVYMPIFNSLHIYGTPYILKNGICRLT